ncbi:unnamed protein product [Ilex paraguariensis]|uniref:Uncharacterized protein n=1 Tax=Ilex paraguariensis TaxID=185542 RepID=A0ABC8QZF7_9AQUA
MLMKLGGLERRMIAQGASLPPADPLAKLSRTNNAVVNSLATGPIDSSVADPIDPSIIADPINPLTVISSKEI